MVPSMDSFSRPKSISPSTSMWIWISATSGSGMATLISPRMAIRTGSGTSRMTPTSKSIRVGVPQPTDSIGPNR